jgi:hypothetical protein
MTDAEGAWVDSIVAAMAPVKDSTLEALDLTKGLTTLWSTSCS